MIPSKIYRIEKSADTFAWARQHINNAPDGSVFLADVLERARGRQARPWMFYEGQLAVTLLLKPPLKAIYQDDDLGLRFNYLTMALSLGILSPIKNHGITLKWPNDFIFEGKKLGGMMCELVWKGDQPYAVIVGFALNVNNVFEQGDPLYVTATSLHSITHIKNDLNQLLHDLFVSLDQWYQCWLHEDFVSIHKNWKAQQFYVGKQLSVHNVEGQRVSGQAIDFLPNGDLVMEAANGYYQTLPFYMVQEVELSE